MGKGDTKKIEIEVPERFTPHLAAFLRSYPHVKKVWVNEKGEYHLSAKEGFDEYDVEDILNKVPEPALTPAIPSSTTGSGEGNGTDKGKAGAEGTTINKNSTGSGEAK